MTAPEGLGLYTRKLSTAKGKARELARRFRDHGLSWVAIGGPWHDAKRTGDMNSPETIARYAAEFERAGVTPWVWGYPWWNRVDVFVESMAAASSRIELGGWLLDPELGLKGKRAELARLIDLSQARALAVGVTSFGLIDGHRRGPRALAAELFSACDFVSPQLYTRDASIPEGLRQWGRLAPGRPIVPSFGLYRRLVSAGGEGGRRYAPRTADSLRRHLGGFVSASTAVRGLIGWELAFMRPPLWREVAIFSDWLARGACALPQKPQ